MVPEPDILKILRYETQDAVEKTQRYRCIFGDGSQGTITKTWRFFGSLSSQGAMNTWRVFGSLKSQGTKKTLRVLGSLSCSCPCSY